MKRAIQFGVYVIVIVVGFLSSVLWSERSEWRQLVTEAEATADISATRQVIAEMEVVAVEATAVAIQTQLGTTNEAVAMTLATTQAQVQEVQTAMQALANERTVMEAELASAQQINLAYDLALTSHRLREGVSADIEHSTLLAIEAVRRYPDTNTYNSLRQSIALLPKLQLEMATIHSDAHALRFSEDGHFLMTDGGWLTTPRLWNVTSGELIAILPNLRIFDWSEDGRYMVVDSWPDPPYIYDINQETAILDLPNGTFGFAATFNSDNRLIAYSTDIEIAEREYEYIIVVQDFQTGTEILHKVINSVRDNSVNSYTQLAFSFESQHVAGANFARVDIWDLASQQNDIQFPIEVGWPEVLLFSPDNRLLAVAGLDGAKLWDVNQNQEIPIDSIHGTIKSVQFSTDSNYLLISRQEKFDAGEDGSWYSGKNGTQVWDVTSGEEIMFLSDVNGDARFIANTHQILTVDVEGLIQIWDVERREKVAQSQLDGQITIEINHDGTMIGSLDEGRHIRLWSSNAFVTIQELHPATVFDENYRDPDFLTGIAYSPTGEAFITTGVDGQVRFWNPKNGREQETFNATDTIDRLVYSSDGTYLAIDGSNYPSPAPGWESYGLIDIWHESEGKTISHTFEVDVNDVVFSPDGRYYATASNIVQLWDTTTGEELSSYGLGLVPLSLDFTPTGNELIVLTENKVLLCAVNTGEILQEFEADNNTQFWTMALQPGGNLLAIADTTTVHIWNLGSDEIIAKLPAGEVDHHYELTFSADGRYLSGFRKWSHAISAPNSNLDIWNTANWQNIRHESLALLNAIAISPDSNYLALGFDEGLISVLAIPNGTIINQLAVEGRVDRIVFHPDGEQIAFLDWDTVFLWQWNPEDWIAEACTRLSRNLTRDEWLAHFDDESYQPTCPNLPMP